MFIGVKKRSVLFSIKPKWVLPILQKRKTIEVRTTKCKIEPNFRAFIYCTLDPLDPWWECGLNSYARGKCETYPALNLNGKIVGHCTCSQIQDFVWDEANHRYDIDETTLAKTGLTQEELFAYGKGKTLYGYHLESVMPYGCLAPITSAYKIVDKEKVYLKRPPQSWTYIDGV